MKLIGLYPEPIFETFERLFEMGFAEQLHEITKRLPETRQTLLFSATLPHLLVEFARAGLTNPQLIRLDTETKISENLQVKERRRLADSIES